MNKLAYMQVELIVLLLIIHATNMLQLSNNLPFMFPYEMDVPPQWKVQMPNYQLSWINDFHYP